jgi:hypothetical protein
MQAAYHSLLERIATASASLEAASRRAATERRAEATVGWSAPGEPLQAKKAHAVEAAAAPAPAPVRMQEDEETGGSSGRIRVALGGL